MSLTVNPTRSLPKLRKLLGPKFGYRVNPKAPTPEERAEAKAAYSAALEKKLACQKRRDEYRNALLAGDQEYQRLRAEEIIAANCAAELAGLRMSYKITAGVSTDMFFIVKAEGDTWNEIIAKLEKK